MNPPSEEALAAGDRSGQRPNILFVVSDEERRNDWMDGVVELPNHERLRREGMSFDRYYTHSSPCSPSRASLYTGRYLAQHGVVDNVSFPAHTALDPGIPTIGSLLGDVGYRSGYLGKWHLSHGHNPDMASYGYLDWQGDDRQYTGNAWTGRYFDPIITEQAVDWITEHGTGTTPWCLTVALVNPHDIMWYPADHRSFQDEHPDVAQALAFIKSLYLDDVDLPAPPEDYPHRFDTLPANFADDLHTKPEVHRAWRHTRNRNHMVGSIDPDDHATWLRGLDYYAFLHEELDVNLGRLLSTLDDLGIADDTMVVYTSDHGDACGSHGLRAKLPCVYEEVMGVPLMVRGPGVPADARTDALATHVDLAATLASIGGVAADDLAGLSGEDLSPVLADPAISVRDHVLFAQDCAQDEVLRNSRYAVRGYFDGTDKVARYYGIGGGIERDGRPAEGGKRFDVDAAFGDQDHEWYDHGDDPHELVNLAVDRGRRADHRERYERLLTLEQEFETRTSG